MHADVPPRLLRPPAVVYRELTEGYPPARAPWAGLSRADTTSFESGRGRVPIRREHLARHEAGSFSS